MYPHEAFLELAKVSDTLAGYHLTFAPMHRVLQRCSYYPFTASGQLTASWQAPVATTLLALPPVSRPKLGPAHRIARVAVLTDYRLGPRLLRVAHLHLENTTGPRGRLRQLELALTASEASHSDVLVAAGDFNTFFGPFEESAGRLRRAGFTQAPSPRLLVPDVDWFFARGARITARRLPIGGSDHRPVLAELQLP